MPRIRSIKPEFWTSGQVLECSTNARLLFIGLWNFCDDAGRHPLRPRQIKAEIFPADDLDYNDILRMIDELSTNDLVTIYSHENQEFIQVNGWHHQRIDRPHDPKHPGPLDDHSTIIRGSFAPDRIGGERIGEDRKGQEKEQPDAGAASNGHDDDPVFLTLPCLKNQNYAITESLVAEYESDFPAIDVRQELRNAVAWVKANPKKKKTLSGARRFLTGWLTRSQNRGGGPSNPADSGRKRKRLA